MDKKKSVIESIQKLLLLRVQDEEIIDNLFDVGLSRDEAKEFIAEAKKLASGENSVGGEKDFVEQKGSERVESKKVFDSTVKKLSMNDQVISQIPFVKKEKQEESSGSESVGVSGGVVSKESDSKKEVVASKKEEGSSKKESVSSSLPQNDLIKSIKKEVSDSSPKPVNEIDSTKKGVEEKGGSVVSKENFSGLMVKEKSNEVTSKETKPASIPSSFPQPKVSEKIDSVIEQKKVPASLTQTPPLSSSLTKPISSQPASSKNIASSTLSSPGFEELWKKGIVVAVNAKLSEMKQLRDEVDLKINQRIDEAVKKELHQTKVLMDSQKELIISSNKKALEQKQNEITLIIDSKISELKQYNKFLEDTKKSIESIQNQQKESAMEIKNILEDAKKTKAQLLIEVNSELIKTKSQAQEFLDSASVQLNQMDERVNKTLELEKSIAEGMMMQAEQKIEQLTIARADELISNLEIELNKLKTTTKELSPEVLRNKMELIEKFRLDFINNMQSSLNQINFAIEELNIKNEVAQKTLEEKTLAIDAKMDELTKFEKKFTQIIEKVLNKHE